MAAQPFYDIFPMKYTSKQVEEMLGVSRRTIRRYTQDFADFLSEGANDRRTKKFTDDDIYILQTIRELYARRLSPDDIRSRLSVEGVPREGVGSALALVPAIAARFKELEAYNRLRDEQLEELGGQVKNIRRDHSEYRDTLEAQRRQLRTTQIIGAILILLVLCGFVWLFMQTAP